MLAPPMRLRVETVWAQALVRERDVQVPVRPVVGVRRLRAVRTKTQFIKK
jgi:hypothetical protein